MNNEIKSVYDPEVMRSKRLDSAKKMLDRLDKEKDLVYVDKTKTFFGVKNSEKDPQKKGYYAIQRIRRPAKDKSELSEITYGCNCFDYVKYIEIQQDFKCKHVLFVELLIKLKKKIEVKDLSSLLVEDLPKWYNT